MLFKYKRVKHNTRLALPCYHIHFCVSTHHIRKKCNNYKAKHSWKCQPDGSAETTLVGKWSNSREKFVSYEIMVFPYELFTYRWRRTGWWSFFFL